MKKAKTVVVDILFDIAGAFLYAIGIYCFAEGANIAPGGISGIAIMAKHIFGCPIGIFCVAANIPLIILANKKISKIFALRTLCSLIISSIILDNAVSVYMPQYAGERIIACVFSGVFIGGGLALIFSRGSSTGGTDIVSLLIEKKWPHIQIGTAIMIIDFFIITVSAIVFKNIDSAMFGIISLFCQTKIIDGVIYGLNRGKQVLIVSEKNDEIAKKIISDMERGATFLKAFGAYTKHDMPVLLCVVGRTEFHKLKTIVYKEDNKAFMIISETTETFGKGFRLYDKS